MLDLDVLDSYYFNIPDILTCNVCGRCLILTCSRKIRIFRPSLRCRAGPKSSRSHELSVYFSRLSTFLKVADKYSGADYVRLCSRVIFIDIKIIDRL